MTSKALGLIETIGLTTAIEAADAAVKAANVTLLGYENARGGGLITIKLAGDVGAVKAAVSAGSAAALRIGQVKSCLVIPRPHEEIEVLIDQVDRGRAAAAPEAEKPKPAIATAAKPQARAPKPAAKAATPKAPARSAPPAARKPPAAPAAKKINAAAPAKSKVVSKVEEPAAPAMPAEPQTEPAAAPAPAEYALAQPTAPDRPEERATNA